jgi:eukaryotic-like serine/threonine-protein kinase
MLGSLVPGDVLASRYVLEARLGRGGMGEVWRAKRLETRERVAVKFLRDDLAADAASQKRFLREARAASAVRHPNVVEMYDVLENEGTPFLVMELLAGETLGNRLRRKGSLSPAETAAILLPVFDAVEAAHAAGIVHRDLKPENIFLARDGDAVRVRVLDFGIAKQMEKLSTPMMGEVGATTAPVGTTGAMIGTPYYMAPEQALGERDVDGRADLWSLGVILYECLSGKRPTEAATLGGVLKIIVTDGMVPLAELMPDLDPHLADEVMDLLRSDREMRASSLGALRTSLQQQQPESALLDLPYDEAAPRSVRLAALEGPRRRLWPFAAVLATAGILLGVLRGGGTATLESASRGSDQHVAQVKALPLPPPSAVAPSTTAPQVTSASSTRRPVAAVTAPSASVVAPPAAPATASGAPSRGPSGLVTDNPFIR